MKNLIMYGGGMLLSALAVEAAAAADAEVGSGERQGVTLDNAAPAASTRRDATVADGRSAMASSVQARFRKKKAAAALKRCFTNMRTGVSLETAIQQLSDEVRTCAGHVQALVALPNGVTIKGGATKADLIVDICGHEAAKERTNRIKKSIEANGLADIKLAD